MNKPYWIICQDKEHAERMERFIKHGAVGGGCPTEWSGAPCPSDDNGKRISCDECWLRQFEIITEDENDGDEEGKE